MADPVDTGRKQDGTWQKGVSGNPKGRPQSKDAELRRKYLDTPLPEHLLVKLELPELLYQLLDPEPTMREVIAARTIYKAVTEDKPLESANERLWPKIHKVEADIPDLIRFRFARDGEADDGNSGGD